MLDEEAWEELLWLCAQGIPGGRRTYQARGGAQ